MVEEDLACAKGSAETDVFVHVVRAEEPCVFTERNERRVQGEGAIVEFIALGEPESKGVRTGEDDFHAHSGEDVGKHGCRVDEVFHERDFVDEHVAKACVVKDLEVGFERGHRIALRHLCVGSPVAFGCVEGEDRLPEHGGLSRAAKTRHDENAVGDVGT